MNKPQPQIIVIWRITLTAASAVPALAASLLLRVGSLSWIAASGTIFAVYLVVYLVYFPRLYKNTSYGIARGRLVLTTGVFTIRATAMPLSAIQFAYVSKPAIGRVFGLVTVVAVAAGGRVRARGLSHSEADRLTTALIGEEESP